MNLKSKFSIWVAGLITVVVTMVAGMVVLSETKLLMREQEAHQRQLVERLAKVCEESLYQNDLVVFNYFKTLKSVRGFLAACFLDKTGKAYVHSDPAAIGTTLKSPVEGVIDLSAPVYFGQSRVGTARLFLSKNVIQDFIRQSIKETLIRVAAISFIALFIGILGALVLAKTLVDPIRHVIFGMKNVAEGRLDPWPELKRQDELGWMGRELNVTINKLKELDEMKQEFVSSVTHELRSPLTAITQFVSLLMDGKYGAVTGRQRESLLTVKNNAIRLSSLVDDLLTTAKIDAKRSEVFLETFDVRELMTEVQKLFEPLALEKGLAFKVDVPINTVHVYADRGKINQILNNLISNAIKFTNKGWIELVVREEKGAVQVAVVDTGLGIPEGDKPKIFDKFFRGASTAHAVKGTGLGLSIVKAFVELQGGTVWVESNPGGGSKFIFNLPRG